jgi:mono/diheme cytochrome c family protein
VKKQILIPAITILLSAPTLAQNTNAGSLTSNPVYQSNCIKCHGKTAEGRFMAGPSLVSGKATALSPDELRSIIAKGKHHMPKFAEKLSASEIDALVDQIRSRAKQK